ncbi:MAG TPA: DNA phosphorothioation system sulfurtransferase DndC, partial [Armatimonadota bacterium]|nr:DNA phosphorothioation system sulfurtransferase DndC [Armatimonadota bacterium]
VRLVQKLIDVEWQNYGLRRRGSIQRSLDKVLREDWRAFDEVAAEMQARQLDAEEQVGQP